MKTSLVAVLFFVLATMAGQEAGTASIQGTILRAGTTQPVAGVRVTGENTGSQSRISATTDAAGAFALTGLTPGAYRLTFVARGYIDHDYGRKIEDGPWIPLEIAAKQVVKDLVVRLTPTGSLEGRVRDSRGLPAVGAPVALLRSIYDFEGKKVLSPVATVDTDDRGEYRFFWITPGRYYLRAGGRVSTTIRLTLDVNRILDPFAETYYPNAESLESAIPIEIRAGADLYGMDFRLQRLRLLRIRGRVIDTQTGRFPADADIGISNEGSSSSGGNRYNKTDGTFEVSDLWPGSYRVVAVLRELAPRSTQTAEGARRPMPASDFMPVRIVDKDVDDVVLRLVPPVALVGRVVFEGNLSPPPGLSVRLQNLDSRSTTPLPNSVNGLVNADASFRIPQVAPGNYQVGVSDAGVYVKQARYGGSDVLLDPLKFVGGDAASSVLEIVLSRNLAQVSGAITNKLQQPVAGARVVLVPERGRHRRDLFKEATTDSLGRYAFTNVSPGDYRVFAWEAVEPRAWFDPEILKKFERDARPVRLRESSSETADAKLIPAEAR